MSLDTYFQWVKAHERLVIIAGVLVVGVHFYSSGLNAWLEHDKRQVDIAKQQLVVAQSKVDSDAVSNKALLDQLVVMRNEITAERITFQQAEAKRLSDTRQQQAADQKMTPSELAARWSSILKIKPEEIVTSKLPDHLDVSNDAAHQTVNILEDYPRVVAENSDLHKELLSEEGLVQTQQTTISGLQKQITDDGGVLEAEKKLHAKEVKDANDKAKRSWLRGFKAGVIVGVSAVEAVRIFVFHKP